MSDIKISVIVPVYNSAVYLRQCLDSLVHQTLRDIEIICAYDQSTDNSLEILNEYVGRYSRLVVLILDENRRLGAARNEALKIAKGEYVGFVDGDDWVELDMYEKLFLAADATGGADIATVTQHFKDREKKYIIEKHIPLEVFNLSREDINKYICKNLSTPQWMNIVKKNLFFENQLFFAENILNEDVPISHVLYCLANAIAVVD